jgi:hypothetical protein
MKKYIREILSDLKLKPGQKKLEPPVPTDLDNQILSKDPAQRVRQLEQQAHKNS